MTFYADIKPIETRAAECNCCTAVLKAIAQEYSSLRRIHNVYRLGRLMQKEFIEAEVRRAALLLVNTGLISSNLEPGTGDLKNLELTETGWAASGADKPFWMGGAA